MRVIKRNLKREMKERRERIWEKAWRSRAIVCKCGKCGHVYYGPKGSKRKPDMPVCSRCIDR